MSSQDNNSHKRYKSDPKIEQFMKDRIDFNKILENKKRNELSAKEDNLGTKLRQDKKRLLDNVIFPSMANLVVFFEYLKDNDELRELYEDDIKELFGYIREPLDIAQENVSQYNERHYVIRRLLDSLLTWNIEKYPNNFRLDLLSALQRIIFDNITLIFQAIDRSNENTDPDNKNKMNMAGLVFMTESDIRRALYWLEFLGSRYLVSEYEKDENSKPSRPIQF